MLYLATLKSMAKLPNMKEASAHLSNPDRQTCTQSEDLPRRKFLTLAEMLPTPRVWESYDTCFHEMH